MTYRSSTSSVIQFGGKDGGPSAVGSSGLTVPRLGTAIKGRDRRAPMVALFFGISHREGRCRSEDVGGSWRVAGFILNRLEGKTSHSHDYISKSRGSESDLVHPSADGGFVTMVRVLKERRLFNKNV
jgi:hypothetical protein